MKFLDNLLGKRFKSKGSTPEPQTVHASQLLDSDLVVVESQLKIIVPDPPRLKSALKSPTSRSGGQNSPLSPNDQTFAGSPQPLSPADKKSIKGVSFDMGKGLAPLPAWVGKKSMGSILDSVTEGPAKPNPNANTDVIGTARPSWADVFPNNEYETPSIRSSTGSTSSGPRRRMSDVGPVSNYRASLLQRQQLDIKEESSSALVPNHISTSNIDQVVRQVTMVPHHEFSFSNYHSTVALGPYSLQLVSFIATGEKDALAEGEIVVALACAGALTPDPTEPAASTDQIQHQASPDLGRSAISGPLPLVTLESPQTVIPASLPQPTSSILSAPLDMPPCSTNAASSADPQASGCTRPRLDPAQISLAFEFSIEYCEKQTYLAVAQYQEHIAPHSLRYRLEVDIKKAFLNNLYLKFKDSKVEATSHSFELCGKGTASIVLNDQGGQHQGILPFGYEVIKVFTPTSSITKLDQTQQT